MTSEQALAPPESGRCKRPMGTLAHLVRGGGGAPGADSSSAPDSRHSRRCWNRNVLCLGTGLRRTDANENRPQKTAPQAAGRCVGARRACPEVGAACARSNAASRQKQLFEWAANVANRGYTGPHGSRENRLDRILDTCARQRGDRSPWRRLRPRPRPAPRRGRSEEHDIGDLGYGVDRGSCVLGSPRSGTRRGGRAVESLGTAHRRVAATACWKESTARGRDRSSPDRPGPRPLDRRAQAMVAIVLRNRMRAMAKNMAPMAATARNCGQTTSMPAPRNRIA